MPPRTEPNHQQRHNKLINEKSPYLLQHATNPVDWYPWGDEAFERAKSEDKPIFLSIGYSTCHWCHVMEHESFEDEKVARLMNETFISIKVDREERPDIDNIYMMVCQMITGSGGWPLTIVMTPEKKPFYAGTYIPKDNRFGRLGLTQLIPSIKDIWQNRREEALDSADKITEALTENIQGSHNGQFDSLVLKAAYEYFQNAFDSRFGGFGRAPKFPTPHNLSFLLRYWKGYNEPVAFEMVENTLTAMRRGGIYDQVGFGFHRYSTDSQWLVPHYEKMLYDQALIAINYIEAYQATGKVDYRRTAEEIFEFVGRDMTDRDGGFHSAIDADSEGIEGKFYLWRVDEIQEVLSKDDAGLAAQIFDVKRDGNFDEPGASHSSGLNILHMNKSIEEHAEEMGIPEKHLREKIDHARRLLFEAREKRIKPSKDDKVLCDWNGLMIAALSMGAQVFEKTQFSDTAKNAVEFVLKRMIDKDGRLMHRYRDGHTVGPANLDDYAFFIWGLIELYQATFEMIYIEHALRLNDEMIERFWDSSDGGFYFVPDDSGDLIVRQKELYDGAVPSGNSVAASNLLRLGRMTGNSDLIAKAEGIFGAAAGQATRTPQAFTQMLVALDYSLGPSSEIIIAGEPDSSDTKEMLRAIRTTFIPNKIVALKSPKIDRIPESLNELFLGKFMHDGKATAYICHDFTCDTPTTDVMKMLEFLSAK